MRLNKAFPRMREFLDAIRGFLPLVDLPVAGLHVHRMQLLNGLIGAVPALGMPDRMELFQDLHFRQVRQLDRRELADILL